MPQNDPPNKKSDGVKDIETGWNKPAAPVQTVADVQKALGTNIVKPTSTGWGTTQVNFTTKDIAKQNGWT